MTAEQLADIEAIKKLKARYFRLMDTKRWEEWGKVFTKDGRLQWGPGADEVAEGRDTIVRIVSGVLRDAVSCHYGHMPEIELIDAENARGVWAMIDLVDHPAFMLRGFGHYHEEYVKQGSQWRIRSTHLTRLREERTPKE